MPKYVVMVRDTFRVVVEAEDPSDASAEAIEHVSDHGEKHFMMSEVVVQELSDDEELTGNEVTH
jgi:hypothetical protein